MSKRHGENLLPGQDLVEQGIADLRAGHETDPALLVLIAAPRLRRLGLDVPARPYPRPYEHRLYARLEKRLGAGAHSHYNSLLRRIVSYARALERETARPHPGVEQGPHPPTGQRPARPG